MLGSQGSLPDLRCRCLGSGQPAHFELPVVPGNPDLVDTLEVEPHPFCHPSFYVDGRSGSGAGLPSHSGRPSDGGARCSPSTQRFAALGEATEADRCGSISLGAVVAVLGRLAVCPGHRETGDGDCLAPQRVSTVLDLEGASRPAGTTAGLPGNTKTDSPDEPRESAVGRAADPRRTA